MILFEDVGYNDKEGYDDCGELLEDDI